MLLVAVLLRLAVMGWYELAKRQSDAADEGLMFPDRHPRRRIALLVFAHPDDEAMFFSPTLLHLKRQGWQIHFMCFSTGDADGKGKVRAAELSKSALMYGVSRLALVDDPRTRDGMAQVWDEGYIAETVRTYSAHHQAGLIVTFDLLGVSGHPNHVAVARGVLQAVGEWKKSSATCSLANGEATAKSPAPRPHLALLVTRSATSTKYTGLAATWIGWMAGRVIPGWHYRATAPVLPVVDSNHHGDAARPSADVSGGRRRKEVERQPQPPPRLPASSPSSSSPLVYGETFSIVVPFTGVLTAYQGMSRHASQFVWYRWLFVFFSSYGFVNELVRIDDDERGGT